MSEDLERFERTLSVWEYQIPERGPAHGAPALPEPVIHAATMALCCGIGVLRNLASIRILPSKGIMYSEQERTCRYLFALCLYPSSHEVREEGEKTLYLKRMGLLRNMLRGYRQF